MNLNNLLTLNDTKQNVKPNMTKAAHIRISYVTRNNMLT